MALQQKRASHGGSLVLGTIEIPCAVVDGETYVASAAARKALQRHIFANKTPPPVLQIYLGGIVDDYFSFGEGPAVLYEPVAGGEPIHGVPALRLHRFLFAVLREKQCERRFFTRTAELAESLTAKGLEVMAASYPNFTENAIKYLLGDAEP